VVDEREPEIIDEPNHQTLKDQIPEILEGRSCAVTRLSDLAEGPATGVLYVVATPIGNLEDASPRALRVLNEVAVVACEDTRRSARLLGAHSIRTPTVSYFEHNEEWRTPELIERLNRGESIAIITDAGTPAISDPGYRLVRAALAAGIRVAAVPGPSAVIAAVSISGLPTDRFTFEGFLPQRTSARRRALEALEREPRTMVFFEAARRLTATLIEMEAVFGADREAAVVREITKTFEESVPGTLAVLRERFTTTEARGEIVVVVGGAPTSAPKATTATAGHAIRNMANADAADTGALADDLEGSIVDAGSVAGDGAGANAGGITVEALCAAGLRLKDATAVIAKLTGASRREVYQQALARRGRSRSDDG
jgi:16S rRNA (cytidine1402-2'-O)-methyltransferase